MDKMSQWPDENGMYPIAVYGHDKKLRAVDARLHGGFVAAGCCLKIEGVQMMPIGILQIGLPDHVLFIPAEYLPSELGTARHGVESDTAKTRALETIEK